jgi:hypothetical protein
MKEGVLHAWVDEGLPCPLPSVTIAQAAAEFRVEPEVYASWVAKGRITHALIVACQVPLSEC